MQMPGDWGWGQANYKGTFARITLLYKERPLLTPVCTLLLC